MMVKWEYYGWLQANSSEILVNDGEMVVNVDEMLVNDGKMIVWLYTNFIIINEYHILDMTLVAVLPSEAGDGLEEQDSYFI